jgi:hypothetical protein
MGKHRKTAPKGGFSNQINKVSALASFELTLRLVNHVDAALAAHDATIAVALLDRAERVADFHGHLLLRGAASA